MSQNNDQFSEKLLSDLLMDFDKKAADGKKESRQPEKPQTQPNTPPKKEEQQQKVTVEEKKTDTPKAADDLPKDQPPQKAPSQKESQRNVPKKKASKKTPEPQKAPQEKKEPAEKEALPSFESTDDNMKIKGDAKETAVDQHPENQDVAAEAQSENKVEDDFFFDLLSFSRNTDRAAEPEQINIDDVAASISSGPAPDAPLPTDAFEKKAPVNEEVASAPQKKKKKKSDLVKNDVKISEHNQHAKLIFIISMILLFLPALAVVLAVLALFVIAAAATLLALGVMSVAIVAVVVVGVLLAMVGAAYGAVNLLTGEGFAVVAGQYELGLGVAIAGVTIIVSSLLYSGVTDLVPYVFKKMRQLFMFLAKKVKKLIVWLYKYSTQL